MADVRAIVDALNAPPLNKNFTIVTSRSTSLMICFRCSTMSSIAGFEAVPKDLKEETRIIQLIEWPTFSVFCNIAT